MLRHPTFPATAPALAFLGALLACMDGSLRAAPLLVSVDFEPSNYTPAPFSGVESYAAAESALYGEANIWNILTMPDTPLMADPSFTGLLNAGGAPSAVDMAITGTIATAPKTAGDDLLGDYLIFNHGGAASPTVTFALSGLTPSAEYSFYTYSSVWGGNSYNIAEDTDGDLSLLDETEQTVTNFIDGYYASVLADPSGQILGKLSAVSGAAHWGGFQLAQVSVPEPGSAFLLLVSGVAVTAGRRRR